MSEILAFVEKTPSIENQWRAIILFGRNTASYKFALAKTLLTTYQENHQLNMSLQDLAKPFAQNLCEHLKLADKQITSNRSQFIDACRQYNQNQLDIDNLIQQTVKHGFNHVLDAFHFVNQANINQQFFIKNNQSGITLTDEFVRLIEEQHANTLLLETESRWRLVETAWQLKLSRNTITVHHDNDGELLYSYSNNRRTTITRSREALNGYQKGRCFYCYDDIDITPFSDNLADVDHFFAHTFKEHLSPKNLDGVWNLVLACQTCNRGENGKFAKVPSLNLLKRLSTRNEYLIASHHPLRETLLAQTGSTAQDRSTFLKACFEQLNFGPKWQPQPKKDSTF